LFLNLLVPLVIFPYVSRILGPAGLGKVEYANSIVSYFVLFAALGIPTYGVREVARRRDDPIERSKVVWELTLILAVTVGIGYIAYFILIRAIPALYANRLLFYVIAPTVFLSCFSYEWFYTGIEDHLYITVRFVFVKILQTALVFLCVKNVDDFGVYAGVTIGLNGFTTVFNIGRLKKYIRFVPFSQLDIKRHIKYIFYIFSSTIGSYIYLHLDVTMVGVIIGDTAVGLYTAANKIVRLIISLIISLPMVMIPRIENSLKNDNKEDYKKYLDKSLQFILFFSVPSCFGIIILAPDLILLFAGDKYIESVLSVRLLAPIIFIAGMILFVGYQVLMPNRKERFFAIAVIIGALINFMSNFFLIPKLGHNGAIIGTTLAELSVLIFQIIFAWELLKNTELLAANTLKYFIASLAMTILLIYFHGFFVNIIVRLITCICIGVFIYITVLFFMRERTMVAIVKNRIMQTWNKRL
jgi:O-antigen/teichoic acid export membrane protein